jgi:hypothetical protein
LIHQLGRLSTPDTLRLRGLISFAADVEPGFVDSLIRKYGYGAVMEAWKGETPATARPTALRVAEHRLPIASSAILPAASPTTRFLSTSDFTLARTCGAKLYFRENDFPDRHQTNEYIRMLAQGTYMVEALAKARYTHGIQLARGQQPPTAFAETLSLLGGPTVTLFDPTLFIGRRLARPNILERVGNRCRLLSVKASVFDGAEHAAQLAAGKVGLLRSSKKPFGVLADWRPYIEDIAYQVIVVERALPAVQVRPYLVLLDRGRTVGLNNVPQLFELDGLDAGAPRGQRARYTGNPSQLAQLEVLTEVDVAVEVDLVRDSVDAAAALFEQRLDSPRSAHMQGVERSTKCGECEFRVTSTSTKNGFAQCWGPLAEVKPHVLDLYSAGTAKAPGGEPLVSWMFRAGQASLLDVRVEWLRNVDGIIGPTATRQRRQIECTRDRRTFVAPSLRDKIEAIRGPVHFIDFETSRLALPYHAKMRPFGVVTFQWSCHTVDRLGKTPRHTDWLNHVDAWPNQAFAESLQAAIGEAGPVLTWSSFEAATLKEVIRDLATFGRRTPDLVKWLQYVIEHRMIDLHEWARNDYFHPGMGGRTSIKVVLDALWQADPLMRAQFEDWTGTSAPRLDPYSALPTIAIAGIPQTVHEGTGAMLAYQEMMYGASRHDRNAIDAWATLLRQYCKLDTLSMVLIFEHWRRVTGIVTSDHVRS